MVCFDVHGVKARDGEGLELKAVNGTSSSAVLQKEMCQMGP